MESAESAFLEVIRLAPAGSRAIIAHAQYGLATVAASRENVKQARLLAQRSYETFELLGHREKKMVMAFLEQIAAIPEE